MKNLDFKFLKYLDNYNQIQLEFEFEKAIEEEMEAGSVESCEGIIADRGIGGKRLLRRQEEKENWQGIGLRESRKVEDKRKREKQGRER